MRGGASIKAALGALAAASLLVARPPGKVLAGGLASGPGSSRFFLRRYLTDGSPDRAFGDVGRVVTLPLVAGTPAPGSGR
jgi:hypothetical protein